LKGKRIKFLNTYIDNITKVEAVGEVERLINEEGYHYVVTPNADHIVRLETDTEFKAIYDKADLILADGISLIWIGKWLKTPIIEKVSGSDLLPMLCRHAAQKGYSVFFLGAADGVALRAAENLKEKYNNLKVVGTYSPFFGFEKDQEEVDNIVNMITSAKPDILFVGLGAPKQEKFIYSNLDKLKVPVSIGIGASIDFEAGNKKRAPKWISESGFEWLYRFVKEPKRLFKRVFIDDIKIFKVYLKYR